MTAIPSQFDQIRMLAAQLERIPNELWKDPVQCTGAVTEQLIGLPWEEMAEGINRSVFINVLTARMWSKCGRPVVNLGHKTAGALSCTRVSEDAEEFIVPPWPAFMIRLPVPFLSVDDAGVSRDAKFIMVATLPEQVVKKAEGGDGDPNKLRWWFKLCADTPIPLPVNRALHDKAVAMGTGVSLWGFNVPTDKMLDDSACVTWERWDTQDTTTQDQRTELVLKHLVLNTCLFVTAPNSEERITSTSRFIEVSKRQSKPDAFGSYDVYDVKGGIQLNLCDAVREYVRTGKQASTWARLVAPHWKRVVHGEGRKLRRLQLIDAYWRGG